jgi:hypothetical protein
MAKVNYVERLGAVTHNGGTLAAMYVSSWLPDENGHIVNSTANLPGVCLVGWSNLSVDGMNFGDINATGTAAVIQKYNIDGN